jgi:hypothetical protein
MVDWRALAAGVDEKINATFGERVRIVPTKAGGYAGRSADPDRAPVELVGVFNTLNDQTMNLTGDHSGQPFIQRTAVQNAALHVRTADLGGLDVRAGDLVVLLDRDETYEINRAVREATEVSMFSLIRGGS